MVDGWCVKRVVAHISPFTRGLAYLLIGEVEK